MTAKAGIDLLVLSPHLDDAVLSCGGLMHRRAAADERVVVLTVFAGDLPPGPPSPLMAKVLNSMDRLHPGDAMALRREEDLAACERLGVEAIHWQELEAPARHPGMASYEDIFQRDTTRDRDLVEDLSRRFAELPVAGEVLAPLGVGSHLDHWIVRHAAERAFGERLAYYEDFPYVRKTWSLARVLGWSRSGWHSSIEPLSEDDVTARVEAITAYRTQVPALFGRGEDSEMERTVRQRVKRYRGERLWRRKG